MAKEISEQEVIATILVNQRFMRNGSPPIVNALDLLPKKLRDEVMGDAKAVVDGLKACLTSTGQPDVETQYIDHRPLYIATQELLASLDGAMFMYADRAERVEAAKDKVRGVLCAMEKKQAQA